MTVKWVVVLAVVIASVWVLPGMVLLDRVHTVRFDWLCQRAQSGRPAPHRLTGRRGAGTNQSFGRSPR